MMAIGILAFMLVALAFCASRCPAYGVMCYYAIRMAVPSCARVFSFSFNTILLCVLSLIVLPRVMGAYKSDGSARKYIKSVGFIVVGLLVLTPFGNIPLSFQLSTLLQMSVTDIFPSVLLALCINRARDYRTFCHVVCVMALFTALYSIYTYVTVDNPMYEFYNNSGVEAMDLESITRKRFGLEFMAVGIYDDKIALSLVCLLLLTFLMNKREVNKPLRLSALVLTFVCMILTAQRAPLFSLFAFAAIMMFDKKNKVTRKNILTAAVLLLAVGFLMGNEQVHALLLSVLYIFNDNVQEDLGNSGSSVTMRFMQLTNVFNYLGLENLLQGDGYGFHRYYYKHIFKMEYYGVDERFLGFESFVLEVLIASGLIGIVIWTVGLFRMFKALIPKAGIYDMAFFLAYVAAIIATNTSGSFYLFFMLAVLNSKRQMILAEEFGR